MKCTGCDRRIRASHPHVELLDSSTRRRRWYHARCSSEVPRVVAAAEARGLVYVLNYYHHPRCPDPQERFNCIGGCFALSPAVEAN
jgi:hypothetical protein